MIGADISSDEIAQVYKDFGIERGSVTELTVTNSEERTYLEGLVDESAKMCIRDRYVGESEITTAGQDGLKRVTEYVTYQNGTQTNREIAYFDLLRAPVTQTVTIGTLPDTRTDSTGSLIWPCTGTLTSYFGPRNVSVGSSNHKGIDVCGSYAQDILAADGGEVIYAGWMSRCV